MRRELQSGKGFWNSPSGFGTGGGYGAKPCCGRCGAGYARVVEKSWNKQEERGNQKWTAETGQQDNHGGLPQPETRTLRWFPTCACPQDLPTVPGLTLDPFLGSGTTALAAQELGRRCVGLDLSSAVGSIISLIHN